MGGGVRGSLGCGYQEGDILKHITGFIELVPPFSNMLCLGMEPSIHGSLGEIAHPKSSIQSSTYSIAINQIKTQIQETEITTDGVSLFESSEPPAETPPSARPHFFILPKQFDHWEPSIYVY